MESKETVSLPKSSPKIMLNQSTLISNLNPIDINVDDGLTVLPFNVFLTSELCQPYRCVSCQSIPIKYVYTSGNDHVYCKKCSSINICTKSNTKIERNYKLIITIQELRIKCPYLCDDEKESCQWKGIWLIYICVFGLYSQYTFLRSYI